MPPTTIRPFSQPDLPQVVGFWNRAFGEQPNFRPLTPAEFRERVLDAPATQSSGLLLAWQAGQGEPQLVGMVHAFRPPPFEGLYANWTPNHYIALLYVEPTARRQGIGSRLLQAAESWLYYCPVHFASHAQPVYGAVEGPRTPLFGSTERMGLSATNSDLINFLGKRGYLSVEPGDVSMQRAVTEPLPAPRPPSSLAALGLDLIRFSQQRPFTGPEATQLPTVGQWGQNRGYPYAGIGVVDGAGTLRGHLAWYPLAQAGEVALVNFRVDPPLRGQGIGSYLLDLGLHEMVAGGDGAGGPVQTIRLHTHLIESEAAVRLYRQRGFDITHAWVNLVKT